MKFKRLSSAADAAFKPAFDLYGISFPIHEQRLIESQRSIMTHPEYLFDLIYDDSGEWCGDMLYWETADFIYVEHFCILPERRGQRCGQRALELLGEKGKTVILEIDPPSDKTSVRRKGFYERCGYHANPFAHVHPPYRAGFDGYGHRLVIMSYPRELSQDEYDRFNEYLKNVVMRQAADTSFEGIAQEIKTRIDRLLDTQPRVIIAIDGRCGAGKSTLAARLAELCGGNVFHMDDFFLRPEQRSRSVSPNPAGMLTASASPPKSSPRWRTEAASATAPSSAAIWPWATRSRSSRRRSASLRVHTACTPSLPEPMISPCSSRYLRSFSTNGSCAATANAAAISSSAGSRLRRNISAKWTFRRAVGLYLRHETNKAPRRAEIC